MSDDPTKVPINILNAAFAPLNQEETKDTGPEHPEGDIIKDGAMRILELSAVGQTLLKHIEEANLKVKILKGEPQGGFVTGTNIAVVTCPATQKKLHPNTLLNFIKAVREAKQDSLGFKKVPASVGKEEYMKQNFAKLEDIYVTQVYVAYQLFKNTGVADLLDEMKKNGNEPYVNDFVNYLERNSV